MDTLYSLFSMDSLDLPWTLIITVMSQRPVNKPQKQQQQQQP